MVTDEETARARGHTWRVGLWARFVGWLRATEAREPGPEEVVTVSAGDDLRTAELVAAQLRSAGVRFELVDQSLVQYPTSAGVQHQLLVFGEDLPLVRQVLAEHGLG